MNRCQQGARLALASLLAVFVLLATSVPAAAQESLRRDAPRDVVLGKMTVELPPVIQMDGKADRLSPGSRIRDTRNMQVLSGALTGQTLPVVYKRDPAGLVHEVWLLTAEEYKQLSGAATASGSQGVQQFIDMLALVFGARR
jgi:hypothetical protein